MTQIPVRGKLHKSRMKNYRSLSQKSPIKRDDILRKRRIILNAKNTRICVSKTHLYVRHDSSILTPCRLFVRHDLCVDGDSHSKL